MVVVISGPKQKEDGFDYVFDIRYQCLSDGNDEADCPPPRKKPITGVGGTGAPGTAAGNGKVGAPCGVPEDCDLFLGLRCGSDRGIPLSATWGTFVCTYALGGCKGRCLGGEHNGTVWHNSTVSANSTVNATNAFSTAPITPLELMELKCPCNCTYTSAACCLSSTGMVYESPDLKVNTTIQAPNNHTCCDWATGGWKNSSGAVFNVSMLRY